MTAQFQPFGPYTFIHPVSFIWAVQFFHLGSFIFANRPLWPKTFHFCPKSQFQFFFLVHPISFFWKFEASAFNRSWRLSCSCKFNSRLCSVSSNKSHLLWIWDTGISGIHGFVRVNLGSYDVTWGQTKSNEKKNDHEVATRFQSILSQDRGWTRFERVKMFFDLKWPQPGDTGCYMRSNEAKQTNKNDPELTTRFHSHLSHDRG